MVPMTVWTIGLAALPPHVGLASDARPPHVGLAALPPHIAVGTWCAVQDCPELFAAKELHSWLSLACPATNFTIGPVLDKSAAQIAVGPAAAAALGVPNSSLPTGNESFLLDSFVTVPAAIVLAGGPSSIRGSLNAVFRALERLGFKFLAHDETVVPACPSTLPRQRVYGAPAFEYRDDNQWQVAQRAEWSTRVGFNGPWSDQQPAMGDHIKYATPPGFVHTSYAILSGAARKPGDHNLPPPDLYRDHPEWFWPRGEAGASTYGQLCWSNASLVAHVTERAREILREQPDAAILSISQNDNFLQCEDAHETAVNAKAGSPIGALLLAVNAIAEALEPEFPHVVFDTLAYQWTRPAPTSGLRPRANVCVRLCSIECDFAHPLTHPNNAKFDADVKAWAKLSNRTYIWNYITNFGHYVRAAPGLEPTACRHGHSTRVGTTRACALPTPR